MQSNILQGWAMARQTGRDSFFFVTETYKATILQDAINGIRNHPTFDGFDITGIIAPEGCGIKIGKPKTVHQTH
jgi:hypothetical protein